MKLGRCTVFHWDNVSFLFFGWQHRDNETKVEKQNFPENELLFFSQDWDRKFFQIWDITFSQYGYRSILGTLYQF